ncbi:MAG: hypothetical protein ACO20Y_07685, partial [Poseidonia sp.]
MFKEIRTMAITSVGRTALIKNAAEYKMRDIGAGTPQGFIDGSTLRAFRPKPLPGAVIRPLFTTFGDRLEAFI